MHNLMMRKSHGWCVLSAFLMHTFMHTFQECQLISMHCISTIETVYNCLSCHPNRVMRFTAEILGQNDIQFERGCCQKEKDTRHEYTPYSMIVADVARKVDEMERITILLRITVLTGAHASGPSYNSELYSCKCIYMLLMLMWCFIYTYGVLILSFYKSKTIEINIQRDEKQCHTWQRRNLYTKYSAYT